MTINDIIQGLGLSYIESWDYGGTTWENPTRTRLLVYPRKRNKRRCSLHVRVCGILHTIEFEVKSYRRTKIRYHELLSDDEERIKTLLVVRELGDSYDTR